MKEKEEPEVNKTQAWCKKRQVGLLCNRKTNLLLINYFEIKLFTPNSNHDIWTFQRTSVSSLEANPMK